MKARSIGTIETIRASMLAATRSAGGLERNRCSVRLSVWALWLLALAASGSALAQSACELHCIDQHVCLGPGSFCTTEPTFQACLARCRGQSGPPDRPPEPDVWGALAVSPSTLTSGYAWNHKSESIASNEALNQCRQQGGGDCQVMKTVADTCLALAVSKPERVYAIGGPIGAGNVADDAAMLRCRRAGGKSCTLDVSFCADGKRHQQSGHTIFPNGNPVFVPDRAPRPAPGAPGVVDRGDDTARFYGSWTASFTANGQTVTVLSIHDARGYRNFNVTSGGNVPLDSGTFTAADGRYHTSAPAPNDSGVYRFVDAGTAVCTNAAGQTLTWKRRGKAVDANTAAKALINYTPPSERPGTTFTKK